MRARVEHVIGVINSRFRGNDMRLPLPEGALPRPHQERLPPRRCLRPRQHLHTAPDAEARRSGLKGRPVAADSPPEPSDRSSTSALANCPENPLYCPPFQTVPKIRPIAEGSGGQANTVFAIRVGYCPERRGKEG